MQDKIVESLLVLNVIDAKTCGLGIFSLKYQSIRISGVSAARLKDLYLDGLVLFFIERQTEKLLQASSTIVRFT